MNFSIITVISCSSSLFNKGDVVYINGAHIQWVKVVDVVTREVCIGGCIITTDSPLNIL